jgi:hypothetical protein
MTPTFYMLLFCTALSATYLVVRLGLLRSYPALMTGAVVNSLFFFLYALSRNSTPNHALSVGVALGVLFTGLSVGLGKMFRSTMEVSTPAEALSVAKTTNA